MTPLGVGIVGFGRIGNEHCGWINASGAGRVVGIADATPARRALAEAKGLRAYPTMDELLADASMHAVLVATPTSMHADQALAALRAGKHVMVEKPVTMTLADAERVAAAAARSGNRVVSVFHNRRWDVDYLTAKQAIASGMFGRVFNLESRLGQFASCVGPAAKEYRPGWRNEAAFGGGALFDWGSHFIDQLWRLMLDTAGAKPVRVFAQLRGNVWSTDCDDFARVVVDFDNGSAGLVELNTTTARPLPRWQIDGERGSASSPASATFDTNEWAQLDFTQAGANETTRLPLAGAGHDEIDLWREFALATRGESAPAVTIESVLPTMRLLDAARRSAATGQAIAVDDVDYVL